MRKIGFVVIKLCHLSTKQHVKRRDLRGCLVWCRNDAYEICKERIQEDEKEIYDD